MKRIAYLPLLIAGLLLSGPALAADASAADKAAMKALVQGQIEAFKRDDGPGAYAFAAPGIQAMFPTPDIFINMVKQVYPQVYRPQTLAFGEVADTPLGIVEKVFITGPDGQGWIALYSFEKEPDGNWKISGCQILKDTAPTI